MLHLLIFFFVESRLYTHTASKQANNPPAWVYKSAAVGKEAIWSCLGTASIAWNPSAVTCQLAVYGQKRTREVLPVSLGGGPKPACHWLLNRSKFAYSCSNDLQSSAVHLCRCGVRQCLSQKTVEAIECVSVCLAEQGCNSEYPQSRRWSRWKRMHVYEDAGLWNAEIIYSGLRWIGLNVYVSA